MSDDKEPSGKFVVRVPRTIHARLTEEADREGVSLNALVMAYIAEGLGRSANKRPREDQ